MGMFTRPPPNLPVATPEYDRNAWNEVLRTIRLYFSGLDNIQHINIATLNINTTTLPTQASLATLRVGDVYVDTSASNVLKVKI